MSLAQVGSHEVQVVVTVTLLVATSLLALLCDYLRYRMYRAPVAEQRETPARRTALAPTLVPEIQIPVRVEQMEPVGYQGKLATRLAAARHQQQIIERSMPAQTVRMKKKMRRAG